MTDDDLFSIALGRLLCWARERREITQRELCCRSNVPQSTLSRIELGGSDAKLVTMRSLVAGLFGTKLSVGEFLDDVERVFARGDLRAATNHNHACAIVDAFLFSEPDPPLRCDGK